ncbi:hypothetical protein ABW19_dt0210017 [Dactylella cylindrospora]|nr:hypothetical protein ABW19_dt0210017 [Dactylella cylindrospora]
MFNTESIDTLELLKAAANPPVRSDRGSIIYSKPVLKGCRQVTAYSGGRIGRGITDLVFDYLDGGPSRRRREMLGQILTTAPEAETLVLADEERLTEIEIYTGYQFLAFYVIGGVKLRTSDGRSASWGILDPCQGFKVVKLETDLDSIWVDGSHIADFVKARAPRETLYSGKFKVAADTPVCSNVESILEACPGLSQRDGCSISIWWDALGMGANGQPEGKWYAMVTIVWEVKFYVYRRNLDFKHEKSEVEDTSKKETRDKGQEERDQQSEGGSGSDDGRRAQGEMEALRILNRDGEEIEGAFHLINDWENVDDFFKYIAAEHTPPP